MAWRDELYLAITSHPEYQLALRHGLTGDQFRQLVDFIRTPAVVAPARVDQIDLSQVRWLHKDVSRWDVTSDLTRVTMAEHQVCLYHSKAGRWPAHSDGVEGNPWVFARFGNVWHAATYEWLRPGQVCKGVTRSGERSIGRHTKRAPFIEWVPASGEEVGWMVSGLCRDSKRNVSERTQVVLARWP